MRNERLPRKRLDQKESEQTLNGICSVPNFLFTIVTLLPDYLCEDGRASSRVEMLDKFWWSVHFISTSRLQSSNPNISKCIARCGQHSFSSDRGPCGRVCGYSRFDYGHANKYRSSYRPVSLCASRPEITFEERPLYISDQINSDITDTLQAFRLFVQSQAREPHRSRHKRAVQPFCPTLSAWSSRFTTEKSTTISE